MFSYNLLPGRPSRLPTPILPASEKRRCLVHTALIALVFSIGTLPAEAANKKPSVKISKVGAVNEGSQVDLSATATDKDGQIANYLWQQTKGTPLVTLNNANTATARFTAPTITRTAKKTKARKLTFKFTATDDGNPAASASKSVIVKVKPVIKNPLANAGTDQSVKTNTLVTLDGSASHDNEDQGQIVKWAWKQILANGQGKAGKVNLNNAKQANPSFTSPATPQTLQFKLTITDNDGKTSTDNVSVNVSDTLPTPLSTTLEVSNATPNVSQPITATASASGGTAPYTVTFDWGDNTTPTTGSETTATHSYSTAGSYTLTTTVKDSANPQASQSKSTSITVKEVVQPISATLSLVASQVEFNNPIQAAITNISGGSKPYQITINWGDGKTSGPTTLSTSVNGLNDEHFYELVGSYTIKVTIVDANNQSQDFTTTATVTEVQAPLTDCN